jgi:uncharacterized protein (DUF1330 family)
MPAYWVARSKVNDPAVYKKYADQVPAILAKYGGKPLARGGRFQIMEGPEKFQRFVVIEFPTFEQGVACFTSDEYEKAAAFRRGGAGEVETVIIEAIEAPSFDSSFRDAGKADGLGIHNHQKSGFGAEP